MTQYETDTIFNAITSNGCREMNEVRFHQAINEALQSKTAELEKQRDELLESMKTARWYLVGGMPNQSREVIKKAIKTVENNG